MAERQFQAGRIGPEFDPELASALKRREWERPRPGVFSCANAWNLLIASFIAYAPRQHARAALEEHRFVAPDGGFEWIENHNDFAFAASDGRDAVVCARGSDRMIDWWDNLRVGLVDEVMGRVHGGITTAGARVWQGLNGEGLKLAKRARRVWLTGHSRGALIMTLAAARWREAGVELAGLYTFGSPRIGDAEFQANLQKAMPGLIHRVQNDGDWMADMPPSPPYEHVHVGELTQIAQPDGVEDGSTPEEKEARLKVLLSDGLESLRGRVLGRHVPRGYIAGLRAYCGD